MKYYHVIYNSSQKGLNGSNGFGIRTATEGTPREYLDAVVKGVADNKFANVVTSCNVPTPQELMENDGKAILRVPPRYFFMPLDIPGGRKIYALGRNIYVGFTETFYYKDKEGKIMGKSGRMGTYLIDIYLFETCPPQDVFDILYEQPKDDGLNDKYNRFVPLDPSPNVNNVEMANLTTGDPILLKVEEHKFTSKVTAISPKLTDLLLAIIDAKLSKRQLFVKYPWQQTHQLIADAFRFLPQDKFPQLTFSTNYTGNGFNAPGDILFMNEYYKAQYTGKGLFVNLETENYQGNESKAFRDSIENALRLNELDKIHKIVNWVLSPEYERMGNASGDTKAVMFIYSQMPDDFNISKVEQAANRDELVGVMAQYFKGASSNATLFIQLLTDKIDNCQSLEQIIEAVKDLEYYKGRGIDVSPIVANQQKHINDILMDYSEPGNALQAIKDLGLNVVRQYTNDLRDGREREDLANALFTIWKEDIPSKLEDIKENLSLIKSQNSKLYQLILQNFSSLFSNTYQKLVSLVNANNKERAKVSLNENIIAPLQSESILQHDIVFQDFVLLHDIIDDKDSVVNAANLGKVTNLIHKIGLADSKVGQTAKRLILNNVSDIHKGIEQLKSIWHLTPGDIIEECKDSPLKKDFIKGILQDGNYLIEEIIKIMKDNSFTENERELFLSSKKYKSAYSSYRRKKLFDAIFGKIASIFKGKPKDTKKSELQYNQYKPQSQSKKPTGKAVDSSSILDESELSDNERKRLDFYRKTGQMPKEGDPLRRFLTLLVFFITITLGSIQAQAASQSDYHAAYGDIKDAPKCYIVSAKTLNVRTSPSLYKGKRKKTKRKDNVGFKLSQGDTIFVSTLAQPTTADGIEWIGFTHDGTDYYTDITKLTETDNPRVATPADQQEKVHAEGFLGWLQDAAPWILLVFTILVFLFSFAVDTPDKDSLRGETRDDTGMRPMFMYSLRPYKFFAGLSLRILIALALSIVIMLVIGGVVWGLLWVVKLILWLLIIIGWILVVIGVICIFVNWAVAIPALIIGGIIVHFQDGIESFGNSCVAAGMAFFDALNMWDFTWNLIQNYWKHAVVISLVPLVLFIIAAIVMIIVAWCMRGYEAFTTHRYNVKHPCPWCHEPSEPAEYYDEDPESGQVALPTNLRPGIYGLLHVTHPVTGNKLPTLIANGRDTLARKCPHCGHFINFEAGTEKHIGFIGMPASGKTSLLCNVIGLMMKEKDDMYFTNTTDENISEIQNEVDFAKASGHLDYNHLPPKTGATWRASIQCILPRRNGGLPYHIYFNDVAGELFTAGGNDKNLLRFSQDVENIVFIIDPWTMKLNEQKVSDRVKKWLKTEEVELMREGVNEEALNAFDSLVNALDASKRDFAKINLTFAFVKSDTGYLEGVNITDENELMDFLKEDLRLGNLVHAAETKFMSISYIAVSVFQKSDKGVQALCDKLLQQLEIE